MAVETQSTAVRRRKILLLPRFCALKPQYLSTAVSYRSLKPNRRSDFRGISTSRLTAVFLEFFFRGITIISHQ